MGFCGDPGDKEPQYNRTARQFPDPLILTVRATVSKDKLFRFVAPALPVLLIEYTSKECKSVPGLDTLVPSLCHQIHTLLLPVVKGKKYFWFGDLESLLKKHLLCIKVY